MKIRFSQVSVPALLYVVQNNLLFLALSKLNAATYQVCSILKFSKFFSGHLPIENSDNGALLGDDASTSVEWSKVVGADGLDERGGTRSVADREG